MKLKQLILGSIFLLFFSMNSVFAQHTISGKITDENGEPIIGATIIKKGTFSGTSTDINGEFTYNYNEDAIVLLISYIGYATIERKVDPSITRLDLKMKSKSTNLDEVVVSGVATSVKRSNAANSVDYIPAREISEITTQSTMDGALYGKFKGAEIRSNSGAPGGGMSIRLRGISTILGTKQPIYIVDGVFVDNSTTSFGNDIVSAAAGGGSTASNQDDATNRIADLDPDDIETIEILKGSSAAAIYGSKAANGVVIITTKNGKSGKTEVKYSQSVGYVQAIKLLGIRSLDREKIDTIFGSAAASMFDQNGLYDYEKEIFGGKGFLSTSRISVSGGSEKTTFYLASSAKRGDGIVDNTGYKRYSLRANVNHQLNKRIKVRMTNNFIHSTSSRGFFNNGNNNTNVGYALAFTAPWEDLHADENGNYPAGSAGSNVLETIDLVRNTEDVYRYIGGVNIATSLVERDNQVLSLILYGGLDHYGLRTKSLFPRQLTYFQEGGGLNGIGGVSIGGNAFNTNQNSGAFLVHNFYTSTGTGFRTQFGLTQESVNYELVRVISSDLNGSQTNLQQSGVQNVNHFIRKYIDQGFFVQEEVNMSDKIIGTIGLRGDKSTRNGDVDKYYFYPKANLAVNLDKFGIVGGEGSLVNALKLRVAYGEAGTFAPFGSKFTLLNSAVIDGSSGLISSATRGNPNIGPQRNKELEFGFDLGLMDNRLYLDATYYIRTTYDFLLPASIAPSSGFTSQISNAGDLQNKGLEIGLQLAAVESDGFTWDTGFKFWKNNSKVTRLAVPQTTTGGFANSLGTYLIQEGESVTQIVGSYDPAQCDECDPDGDGLIKYGDAEPDFNLSWMNSMKFSGFELSFLWHWKKGGDGINLSTLLYDLAGMTWDYDDHTLDPTGELSNAEYRINNFSAGSPIGFVEDNSYIRLREVGLYYNLPNFSEYVSGLKIGVSGKNLINIFKYNSYDPEVSNFGNDAVANSIEVTPYPSTKQLAFHLIATF